MYKLCIIAVVALANASAFADDWATYQHDYQRTGRSDATFDPQLLNLAWVSPPNFDHPIVSGGMVYASRTISGNGWPQVEFAAFDLKSGQERWSNQVAWTANTPALLNGLFVTLDYNTHLRVFNATTGALLTDTALPGFSAQESNSPVLFSGAASGHLDCYVISNDYLAKFDISATSTTKLWQTGNSARGQLAVGGESIFNTGPGAFGATNLSTGTINGFYNGPITGGSDKNSVFDATRNRFYANDVYSTDFNALTAWDYTDNAHLQYRWEIKNGPIGHSSLALGTNGDLYFIDETGILRDYRPDGSLNRSSTMTFKPGTTPVLQNGFIWVGDANNTYALSLQTLQPQRTLPTTTNFYDTTSGEVFDGGFIVGGLSDSGAYTGFKVYVVPEPTSLALLALGGTALMYRRRLTAP